MGRPVAFSALKRHPLPIPDHTQAALSGLKLTIAGEVSGGPAIADVVRSGHGHAVLGSAAVRASSEPPEFIVRPIEPPRLLSKLCLAASAHNPLCSPARHASRMLGELARRHAGSVKSARG